jgi:hypothetical protein
LILFEAIVNGIVSIYSFSVCSSCRVFLWASLGYVV